MSVERFELCFINRREQPIRPNLPYIYNCDSSRGDGGIESGVVGY